MSNVFIPTGISDTIFKERYEKVPGEGFEGACDRVATQLSLAEIPAKQKEYKDKFFDILSQNLFVPGGRIWYNSGRNNPNLLNCFVLGHKLDSKEQWGNITKETIITSMHGGGCGIDFSDVRPRGAPIGDQKGECPGPVELMELINSCAKPIRAGGQRRVALMFSLHLSHPDVLEFLDAKLTAGRLTFANVSVICHDVKKFTQAVKNDSDWELSWKGQYKKTIKAKDLWDRIVHNAWKSAEPGFLNFDLAESESNIHYVEKLVTSNPCVIGETEILTKEGSVRIDSVLDKSIEIWNGYEWSEVIPRITGLQQKIMTVTFNDGSNLTCTEYHRFRILEKLTDNFNTVEAKDLEIGMSCEKVGFFNGEPDRNALSFITITSIVNSGVAEKVYCFNEPKRGSGVFNGILTLQCGEIIMSSYDSCCLGHLVLPRFVENGDLNYSKLANTIRISVRALDNTLTVNTYPLVEMKDKSHSLRRIGLGTTGLADCLVLLGLKYGSEEGNKLVDKLFRFISKVSYESSIMLAVEKGPFSLCDRNKHAESGFIKRMPKKIISLIQEHGIRNCAILTQAPTGTVSLLSGNCSSGVEPMFAPAYERRYFSGEERKTELVFHPLFDQYMKEGKSVEHFVGASDLTVREHLEVQRIVQKHIDNAVSKTINMPKDYSVSDMSDVWLEYLPNLKGTTFYREGSRNYIDEKGVEHEPPLKSISLEEAKKRFSEEHLNEAVVNDCPKGICSI